MCKDSLLGFCNKCKARKGFEDHRKREILSRLVIEGFCSVCGNLMILILRGPGGKDAS